MFDQLFFRSDAFDEGVTCAVPPAEVLRCQIHKRRNVKEYLPENCQKGYASKRRKRVHN